MKIDNKLWATSTADLQTTNFSHNSKVYVLFGCRTRPGCASGFTGRIRTRPAMALDVFLQVLFSLLETFGKIGVYIGPEVGIHVGRSRSLNFPHYIAFCAGFKKKKKLYIGRIDSSIKRGKAKFSECFAKN